MLQVEIIHASECLTDDFSLMDVAYCFNWKQVIYLFSYFFLCFRHTYLLQLFSFDFGRCSILNSQFHCFLNCFRLHPWN